MLGCVWIKEECVITRKGIRAKFDVAGRTDSDADFEIIAVECGGSHIKKLQRMKQIATQIYILPYGSDTPYLWSTDVNICSKCGHRLG